jgi:hypothetical protein
MSEEETVKANLQAIGRSIQSQLPGKHWGFVLLAFPFGTGGAVLYLANGNRDDIIQAMREFIAKNTNNPETFTDQDERTNADQGFAKWWETEIRRVKREEIERGAMSTIRQMCSDAFIAGMVWSPE